MRTILLTISILCFTGVPAQMKTQMKTQTKMQTKTTPKTPPTTKTASGQTGQATPANTESLLMHRAQKALTRVIVHDIFSPPVASRIYLYTSAAAYESLISSNSGYNSLGKSLDVFPKIPGSGRIDQRLTALYAFMLTGSRLVFSEAMLLDSLQAMLKEFKAVPKSMYDNSVRYAEQVSDSIMQWAAGDHYRQTRKLARYRLSKDAGKWLPTPPAYISAVEPYWGQMRTVALDSAGSCPAVAGPAFSNDSSSAFFRQAREVYLAGNNLDDRQRAIAQFWDCNPFYVNTKGHLNFATKKLSPGGHWISIAGLASRKKGLGLMPSVSVYLLTSIALYDAFIGCWQEKYRSNVIRPETFINARIDEDWRPLLQTPPFPEYPSGHSVISAAAAVVLTQVFGPAFAFEDVTETDYGLPIRSFNSFEDAAAEAAISRFYGGIHYRAAIDNGLLQGKRIGQEVNQRIKLTQKITHE